MNKYLKKTVSLAVASALVFSMAGCSFLDKSKDEVLDAADSYAKELAACNIGKLAKLSTEDFEDIQEEWESKLTFSEGELYSADTATVLNAIADTISYEIDEESVEATKKSGEGSVDVTFTIADYSDLVDDASITDADAFASAVADADTTEISVTLEFERTDDGDWLGSNYTKVFDKLYEFTGDEFSFTLPLAAAIPNPDQLDWYFEDEGGDTDPVYHNTTVIDAELDYDASLIEDYAAFDSIYYEVEYNGSVIFTETGTYDAYVHDYDVDSGFLDADTGCFPAGTYTITFYDGDGNVLASDSCTVTLEAAAVASEPQSTGETFADYVVCVEYQTYSSDFYEGTDTAYWYNRYSATDTFGLYDSDNTYVDLTCRCYDESLGAVTYQYYYSADGTDLDQDLGTFTADPVIYGDYGEMYYDFTYENGDAALPDGYYIVIVSHGGADQIIAVCYVGAY